MRAAMLYLNVTRFKWRITLLSDVATLYCAEVVCMVRNLQRTASELCTVLATTDRPRLEVGL